VKHFGLSLRVLAVALLTSAFASLAGAQARTYVSGVGDDANPCSRTAPCKTFAGAISKTSANGEIDCLDVGGFGTVTITKGLTIDCTSTASGIMAIGNDGITVQAGPSDTVTIRNLVINGGKSGYNNGISFFSGQTLHLENVDVVGFLSNCVNVSVSATVTLSIQNATLSDCGNAGIATFASNTSSVSLEVDGSRILSTGYGLLALNGTHATIRNSVLYQNYGGVLQYALGAGGGVVTIVASSVAASSSVALQSYSGGYILAFGNSFLNNSLVFSPSGGSIYTGTDNISAGNGSVGTANGGNVLKV
jgi:hypothetical protein